MIEDQFTVHWMLLGMHNEKGELKVLGAKGVHAHEFDTTMGILNYNVEVQLMVPKKRLHVVHAANYPAAVQHMMELFEEDNNG